MLLPILGVFVDTGFPGDICLGSRPSSTSLSLEWSPPANDGGNPVESYILQVRVSLTQIFLKALIVDMEN